MPSPCSIHIAEVLWFYLLHVFIAFVSSVFYMAGTRSAEYISRFLLLSKFKNTTGACSFPSENNYFSRENHYFIRLSHLTFIFRTTCWLSICFLLPHTLIVIIYCVPGAILSTLYELSFWIFVRTLWQVKGLAQSYIGSK